jgi:hypothetical protein
MKHRKFEIASTVFVCLIAGVAAGLALYSTMRVKASNPGLPELVAFLPADSQAVFGMNVRSFISSPAYARFEQKHGEQFGKDLSDFIASTGVDPRSDIDIIVAAGRAGPALHMRSGVVIAQGRFNSTAITKFIEARAVPAKVDYYGSTVLMVPEAGGTKVEKGITFLSESQIALGDLESLKAVLDIRRGANQSNVLESPTLGPLLKTLNPEEMFWFAGDAASVLAKAPANTPLGGNISSIVNVVGTLNLGSAVAGTITVTARDEGAASKLADIGRGFVALGQLAGDQNPELAELMQGIGISRDQEKIKLRLNFPFELLEKLEHIRPPKGVPGV